MQPNKNGNKVNQKDQCFYCTNLRKATKSQIEFSTKASRPRGHTHKDSTCQGRRSKRCMFSPWVLGIFWRRKWPPAPVVLPGKLHGLRSLVGGLWGSQRVKHDRAHRHTHTRRVVKTVKPGWVIMSVEKGESLQVSWWSQVLLALGAFANSVSAIRVNGSLGSARSDTRPTQRHGWLQGSGALCWYRVQRNSPERQWNPSGVPMMRKESTLKEGSMYFHTYLATLTKKLYKFLSYQGQDAGEVSWKSLKKQIKYPSIILSFRRQIAWKGHILQTG